VPIAVVTFQFDPVVQLFGDLVVRWGAVALAVVLVVTLIVAGMLARAARLRTDDVVFIAVGIVPGAIVGGRLGYALLHWDYFGSTPGALLDPTVGGMELGLAVVGGFLTGAYVAGLLGASLGHWLHLAAAPALFALGVGKLTMILSGSGQGLPSDVQWATAYLGPGPWGSLAPALPSHPSQAYEGIATLAVLAAVTVAVLLDGFRRRDGRLFFAGIGLWALARALISTTWREPGVLAGFNAAGLIAVGIAVSCALLVLALTIRSRRPATDARGTDASTDVAWPDPTSRPRF